MAMLNRFVRLANMPLSARALLLAGLGALCTGSAGLINHLVYSQAGSEVLSLPLLDTYITVWTLSQLLMALVLLPAARAGQSWRSGVYVFAVSEASFVVGLMYLFGTMSTPLLAIIPALVIMWALFLDERVATVGLGALGLALVSVYLLEAAAVLPYAPLLNDRSIDAQSSFIWFAAFAFNLIMLTSVCLFFCMTVLQARREQDRLLRNAHAALERGNQLISRYVPPQLVEQIRLGQYGDAIKPERRRLTIVFSDIEGFTHASDQLEAEDLAEGLNEYLSEMTLIADQFGATVNQFLGDGMMIFFGAPTATNDRDHALRAVRMATAMQRRLAEMRDESAARGLRRKFQARIGINTGFASVGDFGSEGRKMYSAIGMQTNIAARIQAQCEPGQVLLSHSTWSLIKEEVACDPRGEIHPKGIHQPVPVYQARLEGHQKPANRPMSELVPVVRLQASGQPG